MNSTTFVAWWGAILSREPCNLNDDVNAALDVAERENPVTRTEVIIRSWTSYQPVDCGQTNRAVLTASISLDPRLQELVTEMPTTRYANVDNVAKLFGPTLGEWNGNTVKVAYSFVGKDSGMGCLGGHATIVVDFKVQQKIPVAN